MKRDRLAVFLLAGWAFVFTQVVKAATLQEFMGTYDWQSLRWAVGLAFMGGALRTIFSLQSDARVVQEIAKEAMWDSAKAIAAGALAYIVMEAIRSVGVLISSEIRFTAVLVAGIFRMDTIVWLKNVGRDWLEARKAQFIGNDKLNKDDK